MKFLSGKLLIQVIHEPRNWQIVPKIAHFFEGIYTISFNAGLSIDFVPEFKREASNWFFNTPAPDYFEDVISVQEARFLTAKNSYITVTPSNSEAGKQEVFYVPMPENEAPRNRDLYRRQIYYVTPQEFKVFSKELAEISEETFFIHDFVKFEDVKDLKVIKFIQAKITTPELLEKIRKTI